MNNLLQFSKLHLAHPWEKVHDLHFNSQNYNSSILSHWKYLVMQIWPISSLVTGCQRFIYCATFQEFPVSTQHMGGQVSLLRSSIRTFGTLKWFFPSMGTVVLHEVAFVVESLLTKGTDECLVWTSHCCSSDHDGTLCHLRSLGRKPHHLMFQFLRSFY